jgi:hypothetical protein
MDEEEDLQQQAAQPAIGSKPQLTVRAKGVSGFVGAAWLQDGRFGKYVSVKLSQPLGKDAVIYLHPRRDCPGVLG